MSYGGKRGLVVFASEKVSQRPRTAGGQFATAGAGVIAQIKALNAGAARQFQAHLVDEVGSMSLERPTVSTGRLVRAMADPRNRFSDDFGWGVGVISFLDDSVAKYWRMIDEGSAHLYGGGSGMIGRTIYGDWGGNISGYKSYRGSPVPIARAPWGAPAGKLRGMTAAAATELGKPGVVVTKEIEPHRYFATANETFQPMVMWGRDVEAILSGALHKALRGS